MNLFFKVLAGLFAILFGFAIVVQFNDSDAFKWVIIYAMALLASILFIFNALKIYQALFLMAFYVALTVIYWPSVFEGVQLDQGMKTENIELARESLGSLIAAVVMLVYALRIKFGKT